MIQINPLIPITKEFCTEVRKFYFQTLHDLSIGY